MKQMGEELFLLMYGFIDPTIMGITDHQQNINHSVHDLHVAALKGFRDRFKIPLPDEGLEEAPFYVPDEDSPEIQYLRERRQELGGYLPMRQSEAEPLAVPEQLLSKDAEKCTLQPLWFICPPPHHGSSSCAGHARRRCRVRLSVRAEQREKADPDRAGH